MKVDAPARPWQARYQTIDAFRALAAMLVVCHHLNVGDGINIGLCSVMVFFVISGYCIAATSQSCLRKGLGFGIYVKRRLRRIYPPYILAVVFFVLTRLAKSHFQSVAELTSRSPWQWLQTATLTQWLSLIAHPISYAADNHSLVVAAFWSLNYEEQFYLVVGALMLLAARFGRSMLAGVLLLMIPALAWNIAFPSISYGFFLEYWVHFSLGVLVYFRLCQVERQGVRRAIDIGLLSFFTFSMLVARFSQAPSFRVHRFVYTEWAITSGFALFLIAMRPMDDWIARHAWGKALIRLGALTYSLYLVHQFNLHLAASTASLFLRHGIPHWLRVPLEFVTLLAVGAVFWFFCERPFVNRPLAETKTKAEQREAEPQLVSAVGA